MSQIVLKKGREKPVVQQHPWVFSGAIERVEGDPAPGDVVDVRDTGNNLLGRGYWNPRSQIQVRMLTWKNEPVDEAWWRRALQRALDARRTYTHVRKDLNAYRLVNAESDYLPGLVVDRYGDWLVLQALTLGIDQRKALLAELLAELLHPKGIYERSDVDVRGKEGLQPVTGVLWGEEPPQRVEIYESTPLYVDVRRGHKTGFYLDQRENREMLFPLTNHAFSSTKLPRGTLLNLFSYTGAFGLQVIENGWQVINVDASLEALQLAEANVTLSGRRQDAVEYVQADVFEFLRDRAAAHDQYDMIVLDPPKFASSGQQVEKAARGYKDINLHAFRCVKPGGHLLTFSCSGAIGRDLFQKIVFGALADSGRQAQILRHLSAADDHPVALTFPEGEYLKGLLLRVY